MGVKGILEVGLRIPEYLTGILVLALAALINVEVLLRYFLNLPIGQVDEIARVLFVWLSFLGAAVGVGRGSHMGVDVLRGRLPPRIHSAVGRLAALLVTVFGAYLVLDGVRLDRQAFNTMLPLMGVSAGWQFLVVPVSGALIVLYGIDATISEAVRPSSEPDQ